MKNKKIYIAGKISGLDYNGVKKKFTDAHVKLLVLGLVPVTPIFLCKAHWNWYRCMAVCLYHLAKCDYIYFLPDWQESPGARIEQKFVKLLNIKQFKP